MSSKELAYIQEVFESNYIAPTGSFLDRFEESIKHFTNAPFALALCNATAGLHLALRVLGIGEGDKVLVSNFTFIASLAPVLYQKATPILIDADESWQMDLELLEEAMKKERPRALILTHLYGGMADMEEVVALVKKYEVHLIEDAAEALGSTFENQYSGTFGEFGIYSFNGNKLLTTGGGGVLVGKDEKLMQEARKLSAQAKEPGFAWYEHETYGYNYRLSNVLAAIGVAQMEVILDRIAKKRQIFAWYQEELQEFGAFMPELPKVHSNRWLTTITFYDKDPLKIYDALKKEGIESRPLWKPMHMQPAFKDLTLYSKGKSEELFAKGLCLPSGTQLTKEEVQNICHFIKTS